MVPHGIPHSQFLMWDVADQDKALAWQREMTTVCKGCGTRASEWEADRFAYVGQQKYCPGCEILSQEEKNVREGTQGVSVYLTPRQLAVEKEI